MVTPPSLVSPNSSGSPVSTLLPLLYNHCALRTRNHVTKSERICGVECHAKLLCGVRMLTQSLHMAASSSEFEMSRSCLCPLTQCARSAGCSGLPLIVTAANGSALLANVYACCAQK